MLLFKQDKPDPHGNSCRSKLASKYSLTLCSYLSSQQIQDAADQGIMFVGFIQEPAGLRPHVLRRGEPEEPSLSLHSSPSSLHGSGLTPSPSPLEEPELGDESGAEKRRENRGRWGSERGRERFWRWRRRRWSLCWEIRIWWNTARRYTDTQQQRQGQNPRHNRETQQAGPD